MVTIKVKWVRVFGNGLKKVEREDEFIVEYIPPGLQSTFYKAEKNDYSPPQGDGGFLNR